MDKIKQQQTPFVDALEEYCRLQMIPFHTPGHKGGRQASAYQRTLFGEALRRDLGLMYALDNLFQPVGPLQEAMALAADLYGAGKSFFSVNGTTACNEAMIMAVCHEGEEIIIPREAHRSVLGGIVLSGAMPVYLPSRFASEEQVSLGPTPAAVMRTIQAHPRAKAVLLTYPTYEGIAIDLAPMIHYAHERGLYVLVDEAHGAHLPFHPDLPAPALACGADCAAQSTHKLTGSLTQTSMLHCRADFPRLAQVTAAMSFVQSTSPNYWLLASLDSARHQLATAGPALIGKAVQLARQVRSEINGIQGLHSFGREILQYEGLSGLDETKICIDFSGVGLSGGEAEKQLRAQGIEVELTAGNHVLALLTMGDDEHTAAALVQACRRIAEKPGGQPTAVYRELPLPVPVVVQTPRQAWRGTKERVPLKKAVGRIVGEMITFYPPGIPVIAPGERLTGECVRYIQEKMNRQYVPNGASDITLQTILAVKE